MASVKYRTPSSLSSSEIQGRGCCLCLLVFNVLDTYVLDIDKVIRSELGYVYILK